MFTLYLPKVARLVFEVKQFKYYIGQGFLGMYESERNNVRVSICVVPVCVCVCVCDQRSIDLL